MNDFPNQLTSLRRLLLIQRTTRLAVRVLWTGLAGWLIAWGLNARYSLFTGLTWQIALSVGLAAPSIIAIFRPLTPGRIAWRMDRLLGLGEQVTTAWQVAGKEQAPNKLEELLLRDAGRLVPEQRHGISKKGWYLRRDLQALGITLILVLAVFLSGRIGASYAFQVGDAGSLPALDQPPAFEDVFPSGIPGLTGALPGDAAADTASSEGLPAEEEAAEISNILSRLGEALGSQPETADIGEALENGDLEGAAAAIEQTADEVDLLPDDARQNMQQALEQAARDAQDAGQDNLAQDLQAAAQALQNPDPNSPLPADRLDELADELRSLAELFGSIGNPGSEDGSAPPENRPPAGGEGGAAGSGSGPGVQGQPEPLIRLEGEGLEFTLEGGQNPSGLLKPGSSPGTIGTAGGGATYIPGDGSPTAAGTVNSILTPYSFSWRWRYVVSEYFSP